MLHKLWLIGWFWFQPLATPQVDTLCQNLPVTGEIQKQHRASPFILAAPHGYYDRKTEVLAASLCQALDWNCIVATGFRNNEHPANVNRPTEGARLKSWEELHTPEAQAVYQCYLAQLKTLRNKNFKVYIELHGNNREASKGWIEVATVGLNRNQQTQLKNLLNHTLSQYNFAPESLQAQVQGLDDIHYTHLGAKTWGVFQDFSPGLALELPAWARLEPQQRTALIKALTEAFKALEASQIFP